jgi:lipopolysaccharide transport system ATP-binding protein
MMTDTIVLKAKDLTKCFTVEGKDFFALKSLNFEIQKGEFIGIIGSNGSGKSTLLKIISEIIAPTGGSIEFTGKIHSILDIGTGFHPELSGLENIRFNSALFGLNKKEVDKVIDAIIEFSGVKAFIHEPVKNYSSGMYLRLALSIALFVDFDILIVDEVINVGDAEFREKALSTIVKKVQQGKSCVLVSHDMNTISTLCNACIVMEKGEIIYKGHTPKAIERYYQSIEEKLYPKITLPIENDTAALIRVATTKELYEPDEAILIAIQFEKRTNEAIYPLITLKNNFARLFSDSEIFREDNSLTHLPPGNYTIQCQLPKNLIKSGNYILDVFLTNHEKAVISAESVCKFSIKEPRQSEVKPLHQLFNVVSLQPKCEWRITTNK